MASMTLNMKNPQTGAVKQAPIGFSWTIFFWGVFPPFFRGDIKYGLILLFTFWFGAVLIFMFIYNKLYLSDLVAAGYQSIDGEDMTNIAASKVGMVIPRVEN
tara:strand:- start:604 stop:909 length:306 start_codon:yes stop_codon:yes gene_type:complete